MSTDPSPTRAQKRAAMADDLRLSHLESIVSPTGVTVAFVAGHMQIGAYDALRLLRRLKAERNSIVAGMRGNTLIFRAKPREGQ